ncbi:sterol 24-C-methyltransferase-like [Patiria miniata]|uniref:Methyltransferase domain-containing protein n=1 Tax=Patiria miniata TaxID=46514 RepID=A0A914BMH3_PATMI|nr:sterol 24-C-methyltransferase-like [Patiria miniata]
MRYVREWLGCMTSARIVCFDSEAERFWLPAHRSGILELKGLALFPPILYGGFHQVAECFKRDGPSGVSSEHYPKFDELMGFMQGPFFRDELVQKVIPSMPQLLKQLNDGIEVLDAGCGIGDSTRIMASRFPKSRFYGLDFSEHAVGSAREAAAQSGLTNVEFTRGDLGEMPADWAGKFGYVYMNLVLHDLPYPAKAIREMYRLLRPGGTLSLIEINGYSKLRDNLTKYEDQGKVNVSYTFSLYNCMPTSLFLEGGAGFGAFWGREEAQKMLEKFKFEVVSVSEVTSDLMHLMCRKPSTHD